MNIDATLLGQMITFGLFVWFTMKFIWPVLEQILHERQKKIADGLAAGERGRKELELAQKHAKKELRDARQRAAEIIDHANRQAALLLEDAKQESNREKEQIIAAGFAEVQQKQKEAREQLQTEMVDIVILGTEKLLGRTLNDGDQQSFLERWLKQ